jgi:hypothetical protein
MLGGCGTRAVCLSCVTVPGDPTFGGRVGTSVNKPPRASVTAAHPSVAAVSASAPSTARGAAGSSVYPSAQSTAAPSAASSVRSTATSLVHSLTPGASAAGTRGAGLAGRDSSRDYSIAAKGAVRDAGREFSREVGEKQLVRVADRLSKLSPLQSVRPLTAPDLQQLPGTSAAGGAIDRPLHVGGTLGTSAGAEKKVPAAAQAFVCPTSATFGAMDKPGSSRVSAAANSMQTKRKA